MLPRLHGSLNAARLVTASGNGIPGGRDECAVEVCHWVSLWKEGRGGALRPLPRSRSGEDSEAHHRIQPDAPHGSLRRTVLVKPCRLLRQEEEDERLSCLRVGDASLRDGARIELPCLAILARTRRRADAAPNDTTLPDARDVLADGGSSINGKHSRLSRPGRGFLPLPREPPLWGKNRRKVGAVAPMPE